MEENINNQTPQQENVTYDTSLSQGESFFSKGKISEAIIETPAAPETKTPGEKITDAIKSGSAWVWIIILAIIAIAVVGYIMYKKNKK